MAREQYPKLAAEFALLWTEFDDVWTGAFHAMAGELAPGVTAEVECPDCEGRGYVDRVRDDRLTDGLSLPRGFFDAPSRGTPETEAYNRVVENLREGWLGDRAGIFNRLRAAQRSPWQSAMMVTIDDTEPIEVETHAVATHSELAGGRVYTTERRWCTCYDDPAPVLGRRTYSLADLIRAHVDRKPWAAAELTVMGERLMSQGNRWGLWLAHWMAPARPRRRRRPRRWSGRLPVRRSKRVRWPTHPARKELEGELAMVANWARAERRRARRRAALVTDPPWVFPTSRRFGGLISPQPERMAYIEGVSAMAGLASAAHEVSRGIVEFGASLERAAESIRHLARVAGLDENATAEVVRLGQEHGDDFARAAINAHMRWTDHQIRGVSHDPPWPRVMSDRWDYEILDDVAMRDPGYPEHIQPGGPDRRRPAQMRELVDDIIETSRTEPTPDTVLLRADWQTLGQRPPPEPAPSPEPSRSRQGPPIGDRLARRLRRRRDR